MVLNKYRFIGISTGTGSRKSKDLRVSTGTGA